MRRLEYILGVALILLLSSCGKQHDAEQLVEQFIQQNAVAPEKIENRDFQKLDSTKAISDSLILTMQQRKNDLFKSAIDYPVSTSGGILYFVGMRFTYEGDTLRHTFYINESFDNIVAFK